MRASCAGIEGDHSRSTLALCAAPAREERSVGADELPPEASTGWPDGAATGTAAAVATTGIPTTSPGVDSLNPAQYPKTPAATMTTSAFSPAVNSAPFGT